MNFLCGGHQCTQKTVTLHEVLKAFRCVSLQMAASGGKYMFNRLFEFKKAFSIQLTHVYGFNHFQARLICARNGISPLSKLADIPESKIEQVQDFVRANYLINRDWKRVVQSNIDRLISIGTYRGRRLEAHMPVHGQRTHTNAKSARKRSGRVL